jgi:hypothetical protein
MTASGVRRAKAALSSRCKSHPAKSRCRGIGPSRTSSAALNEGIVEGDALTVSNCGHAAIDWEVHACDEACLVRSEEQGG